MMTLTTITMTIRMVGSNSSNDSTRSKQYQFYACDTAIEVSLPLLLIVFITPTQQLQAEVTAMFTQHHTTRPHINLNSEMTPMTMFNGLVSAHWTRTASDTWATGAQIPVRSLPKVTSTKHCTSDDPFDELAHADRDHLHRHRLQEPEWIRWKGHPVVQ